MVKILVVLLFVETVGLVILIVRRSKRRIATRYFDQLEAAGWRYQPYCTLNSNDERGKEGFEATMKEALSDMKNPHRHSNPPSIEEVLVVHSSLVGRDGCSTLFVRRSK